MQTGLSKTLIGWKSGKTIYAPLWDRMERAWHGLSICICGGEWLEAQYYSKNAA
jgi:hypothetical protein